MRQLGDFLPWCRCPHCGGRMPIEDRSQKLRARCEDCAASEAVELADVQAAVMDGRQAWFGEKAA